MSPKINSIATAQFKVSATYYAGNFFLNFFRYLFHLLLLRLLTPDQYGEFLTYLSLMYLLAIPTGTISSLITKVVSDFNGKKDIASINSFFYLITKKTYVIAFSVCIFLVAFSWPLSILFKAHQIAFVILGIGSLFTLFQTTVNSYISGLQKFVFQTILGFANVLLTIGLAVALINLNFGPMGAVSAQLLAGLITTILGLVWIKKSIFPRSNKTITFNLNIKQYLNYSLFNALGIMSLMSLDVLMVRVLFSEHNSGIYSSMSVLGRMIFFGMSPLSTLILPMASKRFSEGKNHSQVFKKLGLVSVLIGASAIGVFTLFPEILVQTLSGSRFTESIALLPLFSISMAFFSFNQFLLSYFMAIGKQESNKLLLVVACLQPVLILIFKSTLYSVVAVNLTLQTLLLISLLVYYLKPESSSVKINHGFKKN